MKLTFTFLTLFLLFQSPLFAQELLFTAARASLTNANGDPITNIIDADGMQQGEWFYTDIYDNAILRKEYVDNICVNTYYNNMGTWVNANTWEQNLTVISNVKVAIKALLSQHHVELNLNANQQIALFFDANGDLTRCAPLGSWSGTSAKDLTRQIKHVLENQSLNTIQNETFILY